MKATLEFNLPEDNDQYQATIKAVDYYLALFDMREFLRSVMKYNIRKLSEDQLKTVEYIQSKFIDILDGKDINLELLD